MIFDFLRKDLYQFPLCKVRNLKKHERTNTDVRMLPRVTIILFVAAMISDKTESGT